MKSSKSITLEYLSVDDLMNGASYQRAPNQAWVRKRVPNFEPDAFGVLFARAVEDKKHGKTRYELIDGQHRKLLWEAMGFNGLPVPVEVAHGYTLAEAAKLLAQRNDSRKLTPAEFQTARYLGNDRVTWQQETTANKYGWYLARVDEFSGKPHIRALPTVWQLDAAGLLGDTLFVTTGAWDHSPFSVLAPMLHGIANAIQIGADLTRLVKVLKRVAPEYLLSEAKMHQPGSSRGTIPGSGRGRAQATAVTEIIIKRYNNNLRKGRIGEEE